VVVARYNCPLYPLTTPLVIEVPVPSQESDQSCIYVLEVSILPPSTILILKLF